MMAAANWSPDDVRHWREEKIQALRGLVKNRLKQKERLIERSQNWCANQIGLMRETRELEYLLEGKRVDEAVAAYCLEFDPTWQREQQHQPPCSMCHTPFRPYGLEMAGFVMTCCGAHVCGRAQCRREAIRRRGGDDEHNRSCPVCGDRIPSTDDDELMALEPHVRNGQPWAMRVKGSILCRIDRMDEGVQLLEQSASEGDEEAARVLIANYKKDNSAEQVRRLLQSASDRGNVYAQCELGKCCMEGTGGPRDVDKALMLASVAAARGLPTAQEVLAGWYREPEFTGGRLEGNIERVMYWNQKVATLELPKADTVTFVHDVKDLIGLAQYNFAVDFSHMNHKYLNGLNMTGCSPICKQIYWLEKAGDAYAAAELSRIDGEINGKCACCSKKRYEVAKLSRCSGCKGAYYCGAVCQKSTGRSATKWIARTGAIRT
jgi:hypothetical protein